VLNFEGGSVFCREIYKIDIYSSTPSNRFSSQNFLFVKNIYLQFGQMQNQKETMGNSHGMNDRGEICNLNRMLKLLLHAGTAVARNAKKNESS
jgi:hypothetical protein